ncbi:MAG TPA: hypothetical protein VIJ47_12615 [Acidimicrobiales bacterium]
MTAIDDTETRTDPEGPEADADYVDEDDDFLPARRRRLGPLTVGLALVLVAALGVYGGIQAQKHLGKATTTAAPAFAGRGLGGGFGPGAATGPTQAGGTGSSGGPAGAQGGAVFGTIKLVDGTTIYVTASDGSITKVTTAPATTISRSVSAAAADLQPGQTVVVQGAAGADGTVAATRVTEGGSGGGRGAGSGG